MKHLIPSPSRCRRVSTPSGFALALLVAVLVFSWTDPAPAATYGRSQSPYWKVGNIDKALSAACRRGEFTQRKKLHLVIGYEGKKGMGVTGIARRGWNLFDPLGLAEPNLTYHFYHDGYSDCTVYTSETRRNF